MTCEHIWKCEKCGDSMRKDWREPSIVGECGRAVTDLDRYIIPGTALGWKVVKPESFDSIVDDSKQ
jgi:hypothetical protein